MDSSLNLAFDIYPIQIENDEIERKKRDLSGDDDENFIQAYDSTENRHGLFRRAINDSMKMPKLDSTLESRLIDFIRLKGSITFYLIKSNQ